MDCLTVTLWASPKELFQGTTKICRYRRYTNGSWESHQIYVNVSPHSIPGVVHYFPEEGNLYSNSPARTMLCVVLNLKPDPLYHIRGHDVYLTLHLFLDEAINGFVRHVEYLSGNSFTLHFPHGLASSDQKVVYEGHGFWNAYKCRYGNLIVNFVVDINNNFLSWLPRSTFCDPGPNYAGTMESATSLVAEPSSAMPSVSTFTLKRPLSKCESPNSSCSFPKEIMNSVVVDSAVSMKTSVGNEGEDFHEEILRELEDLNDGKKDTEVQKECNDWNSKKPLLLHYEFDEGLSVSEKIDLDKLFNATSPKGPKGIRPEIDITKIITYCPQENSNSSIDDLFTRQYPEDTEPISHARSPPKAAPSPKIACETINSPLKPFENPSSAPSPTLSETSRHSPTSCEDRVPNVTKISPTDTSTSLSVENYSPIVAKPLSPTDTSISILDQVINKGSPMGNRENCSVM